MRKVSLIVGFCVFVALGLTLAAQDQDLKAIMQSNRTARSSLNMSIMAKDATAAMAAAQKLQQNFTQAANIFQGLKSEDAVSYAKEQVTDLAAVEKAVQANDWETAATTAGAVQMRCGACHRAHREQLPDKSFRFKP